MSRCQAAQKAASGELMERLQGAELKEGNIRQSRSHKNTFVCFLFLFFFFFRRRRCRCRHADWGLARGGRSSLLVLTHPVETGNPFVISIFHLRRISPPIAILRSLRLRDLRRDLCAASAASFGKLSHFSVCGQSGFSHQSPGGWRGSGGGGGWRGGALTFNRAAATV